MNFLPASWASISPPSDTLSYPSLHAHSPNLPQEPPLPPAAGDVCNFKRRRTSHFLPRHDLFFLNEAPQNMFSDVCPLFKVFLLICFKRMRNTRAENEGFFSPLLFHTSEQLFLFLLAKLLNQLNDLSGSQLRSCCDNFLQGPRR